MRSSSEKKHLNRWNKTSSVDFTLGRINIINKYCRLLTIQYSQPCSCAYSRSNMNG